MTEESHLETLKSMCKTTDYAAELSSDSGYEMVCTYAKSHPDEQKIIQEVYTYLSQFKHFDLSNYKKQLKKSKIKPEKVLDKEFMEKIINNNYKIIYRQVALCVYYSLFKKYTYNQLYILETEDTGKNNYIDFSSNKLIIRMDDSWQTTDTLNPEFCSKLKELIDKRNLELTNESLKKKVFLSLKNQIIPKASLLATFKRNMLEL